MNTSSSKHNKIHLIFVLTLVLFFNLIGLSLQAKNSPFIRGDSNSDGTVDSSDPVFTLSYIFLSGESPTCLDSADADDDGILTLGDAISTFLHLFRGLPLSGPSNCGADLSADNLDCLSFSPCHNTPLSTISITEFGASNSKGLLDEDGDSSDWIELHHDGRVPLNLLNWYLTDDLKQLDKWAFPDIDISAGGYLVVFASGKNRKDNNPQTELHTNFQLDSSGEFLALVAPDGQTLVCQFSAKFPKQKTDISFGLAREPSLNLIPKNSPGRYHVPQSEILNEDWTAIDFDDSNWKLAQTAIGYSHDVRDPSLIGYWNFNDIHTSTIALDSSGNNHHAQLTSQFALIGSGDDERPTYSGDREGHSGLSGDYALDFGAGGNGAVASIERASAGAFDSAVAQNTISISIWAFGGPQQPFNDSVFYASNRLDSSGNRVANAHLPWSDGVIYWDTNNCCDGTQRIQFPETDSRKWKGSWNHYVFIKDGDKKEIWQNGELFHSETNTAPLTLIRSFLIGSFASGSLSYAGLLDDFAVWSRALSEAEILNLYEGSSPLSISSLSHSVASDVESDMHGINSSLYLRLPFEFQSATGTETLLLRMAYNDGFIAYLNGTEIARRNAPEIPKYNSSALTKRDLSSSLNLEDIDISIQRNLLIEGLNILAIHGLNFSSTDDEFLISPQLLFYSSTPHQYMQTPTPGAVNQSGLAGFVSDTQFSLDRGFYYEDFEVEISSETPEAEIYFTTDGSEPSQENPKAQLYTEPIPITRTTILRAVAFKEGLLPTNIDTQSYIFPVKVAQQPARPAGFPPNWSGGFNADYQVDPDVVNTTLPDYSFEDALLSIPSISLVLDPEHAFGSSDGIYFNSNVKSERPCSIEWIDPNSEEEFQVNAGTRIHGLTSRRHNFTPKHSFRVHFKGKFGPRKLNFPLFKKSPVDRFDQFVLKGMSTDSWCVQDGWNLGGYPGIKRWYRERATYMREQWMKDSLLECSQASTYGRFVHVYLNGLYWGLYNLSERPSDSFQSEHYGGRREDYDVIKDFAELHSGTMGTWNAMMSLAASGLSSQAAYQRIQGNNPDGSPNSEFPVYLNVDNLIDYMILHIYSGADDWPNHNWWAARRRGAESEGFRFFVWDQEITHNALQIAHTSWGQIFEEVAVPNTPSFLYSKLRENEDFRRRFGDRVHLHLFNGGSLSPEKNYARQQRRATEIDQAIVAESARWGDSKRSVPFKREVEWLDELSWFETTYWPRIHPIALNRFKRVNLYPDVEAPIMLINDQPQHGGNVTFEEFLTFALPENSQGQIYFTLDGTDPRDGNSQRFFNPIFFSGTTTVKARTLHDEEWSALSEAIFEIEE